MLLHPDRYSTSNVALTKHGVVVHDSESGDGTHDVLLRLLQSPGDRLILGSSPPRWYGAGYHAISNGVGGWTAVADATAGPFAAPPRNKDFWHVCMPGRAAQTREEWLDPISRNHILGVAKFIVSVHRHDGIPLYRLSSSQLLAGDRGYCGHAEVSNAWGQTDHTDPGRTFPWDVLAGYIDSLAAPLPPPPPASEEDDFMNRYIVVGDGTNKAKPERYLYDGIDFRQLADPDDLYDVMAIWGLNYGVHGQKEPVGLPEVVSIGNAILAAPYWKSEAWIAQRLAG